MKPFLEKTADYLFENYAMHLGEIAVVLPSRRAGLFLKKHLASRITKPAWAPRIFAIEDFVAHYAGLQPAEKLTLLFELYETHREIAGNKAQSFDDFLGWGNVLLSDFNDIDLHLGDASQIFQYLSDTKAIELWEPAYGKLTDFQKNYLAFFNSLEKYYKRFKERLQESKLAYNGMAYRHIAEQMDSIGLQRDWHKIIFAGFNALSKSEEKIIDWLIKNENQADLLWNADQYYLNDQNQEAGRFLRKYKEKKWLHHDNWIENDFKEPKYIGLLGVPQSIGQVKVCGDLLNKLEEAEFEEGQTAVVLANENLLLPVLNSLPSGINAFNITMGLSLRQTPFFDLLDAVLAFCENRQRFNDLHSGKKEQDIYYRDLVKIIEHPYFKRYFLSLGEGQISVAEKIKNGGQVFYSTHELKTRYWSEETPMPKLIEQINKAWNYKPHELTGLFRQLIDDIRLSLSGTGKESSVEMEQLFSFAKLLNRFEYLITKYTPSLTLRTFRSLFRQLAQTTNIPFYGEPLQGLQVMGILETRSLSFKNLIMLSVNDDQIPAKQQANSFIPYEIKKTFKLPTFKERDSIYAYHFYRLLQQCQNIYLTYNTEPGNLGSGDRSRFIAQLFYELPRYNDNITIEEKLFHIPLQQSAEKQISLPKTQDLWDEIRQKTLSGLSPTSISSYINCPLKFYFENIASITNADEMEETIDYATLGTVVHEVLQNLYEPYIGKTINESELRQMKAKITHYATTAFKKNYLAKSIHYGKNRLIYEVALSFLENFIETETEQVKNDSQIEIIGLEEAMNYKLEIEDPNEKHGSLTVRLKGKIDRIDCKDSIVRVVDYKTGSVDKRRELTIKDWDNLKSDPKLSKALQMLIYGYLWAKHTSSDKAISSGIVSLRNFSEGFQTVAIPGNTNIASDEIKQEIEKIVKTVFIELLNKELPITQTENLENCKYCPFKQICIR